MGDLHKQIIIVIADDNPDDCLLAQEALTKLNLEHQLDVVPSGEALLDYLYRREAYESLQGTPLPGLILLDLNMPHKNGLETLREIKSNRHFRRIPIVVLATSEAEDDVYDSYDSGANSFVTKSVSLSGLVEVVEEIGKYWLEIVELPPESSQLSS